MAKTSLKVRQTEAGVVSLAVTDADEKPKRPAAKKKKTVKATKPIKKAARKKTVKKAAKKISKATAKSKTLRKTKTAKKAAKRKQTAKTTTKKIAHREVIRSTKREPLGHLLVEHVLREAGFRGVVTSDPELLDRYATDESVFSIRPQIVLQPKHQRDVEIAVGVLKNETLRFPSLSLTPRAAGTGLSGGALTDSIVIDVAAFMQKVGEVKTRHGVTTITCEPGAMWQTVERQLKPHGVYLPPYPASKDICSIGGSVANNAAGPDSLRYGHMADWIASLDVTLHDGQTYTVKPLTYKEYRSLIKKKHAHAKIAKEIFTLISDNETTIRRGRPKTKKNSAGYQLWDVIDTSVKDFKKGNGTFDLTRLIAGSQGTIGIITSITLQAEPISTNTPLIAIPVFDLATASQAIEKALEYKPINVEIFDALTYDLAMQNPHFFRTRLSSTEYYKVLLSLYTTHHVRYRRKIPDFTLLVTLDNDSLENTSVKDIIRSLRTAGAKKARVVSNAAEREMLWQVRRASYSLSKFQAENKRPAAFLEDMTVPPKNIAKFFTEIQRLLKKYRVTATVHGHGGNGHFHFYPLLDFENRTTPALIMKMAEEFYNVAIKYDGGLCGEHNDGIIRTPHLNKMFSRKVLQLFEKVEHIFDPVDIFNPGKKVNPRFDIKESIRKTN